MGRNVTVALAAMGSLSLAACASASGGFTPDADDGAVTLSCAVLPTGHVTDCRVISESPPGMDLGAIAVEAAADARLSARSMEGIAPGGRVEFTIRFKMENGVLVERPS